MTSPLAAHWSLDPSIDYLNHGSFGACPNRVLRAQDELRAELEAEPVQFFSHLRERQDVALAELGRFVGADAADLGFVSNATTGVNTVLRSLKLARGDELLVTDHAYNACRNAVDWVASEAGAAVVVVTLPMPVTDADALTAAILEAATPRTVIALIDHITSPTAIVLPVADIVSGLGARGIDVLVDGAHAPGMLDLNINAIGAAYYTGNCHKWMCAPKGVGFLHVRRDRQAAIVPPVISHGANIEDPSRSRFQRLFDWLGTDDPTQKLCVPKAIDEMAAMAGDWERVRERNRSLCLEARALLIEALDAPATAPPELTGSMAAVILGPIAGPAIGFLDRLSSSLFERERIEVPIFHFAGQRVLRISLQLYNSIEQIERLAEALGRDATLSANAR